MTTPPEAAPMREDVTQVTDADREAALAVLGGIWSDDEKAVIRQGNRDSLSIIQAFARHRLAHTAHPDAGDDVERVALALLNSDRIRNGCPQGAQGVHRSAEYAVCSARPAQKRGHHVARGRLHDGRDRIHLRSNAPARRILRERPRSDQARRRCYAPLGGR